MCIRDRPQLVGAQELTLGAGGNCGFGGGAGGRDEETYSRYATGIQVKQYPSWRQHKPH